MQRCIPHFGFFSSAASSLLQLFYSQEIWCTDCDSAICFCVCVCACVIKCHPNVPERRPCPAQMPPLVSSARSHTCGRPRPPKPSPLGAGPYHCAAATHSRCSCSERAVISPHPLPCHCHSPLVQALVALCHVDCWAVGCVAYPVGARVVDGLADLCVPSADRAWADLERIVGKSVQKQTSPPASTRNLMVSVIRHIGVGVKRARRVQLEARRIPSAQGQLPEHASDSPVPPPF